MAMNFDNENVTFDGVIYEDEIPQLRDYLQTIAPQKMIFDFKNCEDVHLAMLQVIMAYKKMYECEYEFSDKVYIYQKVLEGFETSEDHCH
jgi:hypothetical protein